MHILDEFTDIYVAFFWEYIFPFQETGSLYLNDAIEYESGNGIIGSSGSWDEWREYWWKWCIDKNTVGFTQMITKYRDPRNCNYCLCERIRVEIP